VPGFQNRGNYILDRPKGNPKGCKESSRWSESAETTGKVIRHDRTPEAVPDYAMNIPVGLKIEFVRNGNQWSCTPPGYDSFRYKPVTSFTE